MPDLSEQESLGPLDTWLTDEAMQRVINRSPNPPLLVDQVGVATARLDVVL